MVEQLSYQKMIIWDSHSVYAYVRCDSFRQIKLVEMVNDLSTPARQAILLYTFESMRKDTIDTELGKTTSQIRQNMLVTDNIMKQFVGLSSNPSIRKLLLNKLFKQWPYHIYAEILSLKTNAIIVR